MFSTIKQRQNNWSLINNFTSAKNTLNIKWGDFPIWWLFSVFEELESWILFKVLLKHAVHKSEHWNSPADFHTPEKDKLFHSPSAGLSLADMSPFCLLHTCNTAACPTSTQTSAPSSCVQDDPVIIGLLKMIKKYVILSEKQHSFLLF